MSFTRRGASLASRLRVLSSPAGQATASETSTTAACAVGTPTLHSLDPYLHSQRTSWGGGEARGGASFGFRSFSIFPGSGSSSNNNDNSSGSGNADGVLLDDAGISTSASLASETVLSPYNADSIVQAVGLAEAAAVEAAMEGCWAPTRLLQWAVQSVHEGTGFPWWASIMLTTVGIRAATYPLTLMQIKNTHRLSQARPEIERLMEHLKEEQARGNPNAASEHQKRVMAIWQKYEANPMKSMVSLFVQAPLFIGFFSALRGLAAAKVPSLTEGGALWFTDLTVADPTHALPIIASLTFLLTIEVGAADGMEGQPDKMKKRMKNIMRAVAVIIVPFTMDLPAAVFCYWTASNTFSLLQALVLKLPGVKKALGVPDGRALAAATAAGAVAAGGAPTAGKPIPTFSQKPKKK